tara:strand:- start:5752 stop:7668 length:1917 start_codon:yes stop_codon:yes gene_type:complete
MALKRYKADADTTIVNAYQSDMQTRATGANAGEADVLETFSIYARQTAATSTASGSSELSRILIKFPISDISTDRTNSVIPASGSVSFYLRMYNAQHSKTVPRDFKLIVSAISHSWQEGVGLDLEQYKDLTKNKSGTNWINANNNFTSASATVTALSKTAAQANTRVLTIADSSANSVSFTIDNSISTSTATKIAFGNANSDAEQFATNIVAAVNLAQAASTLNVTGSSSSATVTLKQTVNGIAGNSAADIAGTAVDDSVVTIVSQFSGGDGAWSKAGGDYLTGSGDVVYTQSFTTGLEDLEINISDIVENWITGSAGSKYDNYGLGIFLSSSYEAYTGSSAPQGSNLNGATTSYYTKRFFARGSQYFFKRPVIEARWDDSTRDDRGDFYYSSSLAPAADNLNKIYLYNYVRGTLKNIPRIGTGNILVSLYSGSSDNSAPSGSKLSLHDGTSYVTGGYVSTGIYSASIAVTAAATPLKTLYDVWYSGSVQYSTGSILPKTLSGGETVAKPTYYLKITNLRNKYRSNEVARFNLFCRNKYWNPTVYTAVKAVAPTTIIQSASYRVYRVLDAYNAIPYGTGSDLHTVLSYDVSGNYFDFDMNLLEPGYAYAFKFAFYDAELQAWMEQNETFKFRVEDYEY